MCICIVAKLTTGFLPEGAEIQAINLTEIIEAYGMAILKYCHSILYDYHEAQDAAQITFVKAYTKGYLYKAKGGISPWLYKIAYNTCLDILRKKKFVVLTDSLPEGSYEMPDISLSEELKAAFLTISPTDRALVYSRVINEMDYKELSIVYGASVSALQKRYERAKKKLAKAIIASRKAEGSSGNGEG